MACRTIAFHGTSEIKKRRFEGVKVCVTIAAGNLFVTYRGNTLCSSTNMIYIDWGDGGNIESVDSRNDKSHAYAKAGTYTITMTGNIWMVQKSAYPFIHDSRVTSAYIGASVGQLQKTIEIGAGIIDQGMEIKKLEIAGESVQIYGKLQVLDWATLETVVIDSDGATIGNNAFSNTGSVKSLKYFCFSNVSNVGASCFEGCSELKNVFLPEGMTSIGEYAFCGCASMTHITLPSTVTVVGKHAFEGCTGIVKADFSKSKITLLDEYVLSGRLENSANIEEILLPSTLAAITCESLNGCNPIKLTEMTVYAENPPAFVDGYMPSTLQNVTLRVPSSAVSSYRNNASWNSSVHAITSIS